MVNRISVIVLSLSVFLIASCTTTSKESKKPSKQDSKWWEEEKADKKVDRKGTSKSDPDMPKTVVRNAKLEVLYSAKRYFGAPTWDPFTQKLYFSAATRSSNQIYRLDEPGKITVWMDKTEKIVGTYLSLGGRLLCATANGHRVESFRIGSRGPINHQILASNQKWNQPNDICQTSIGYIYFTDPDFNRRKSSAVYVLTPKGSVKKVIDYIRLPNGIISSNDGKTLYIADSSKRRWHSFPIYPDGSLGKGKVFFNPVSENRDTPDGMSIDELENLYFTGLGGVWVVSPSGKSLGQIKVPEYCSNVTFGGPKGKTLFITCRDKVYGLEMRVRSGQYPMW